MGEPKHEHIKECLEWILMVSVSPVALLLFMLMALYSLLRFLCKVALLLIIVTINTPFAVMYNVSLLVFQYHLPRLACFRKFTPAEWKGSDPRAVSVDIESKSSPDDWNRSDPRVSVGIEVKILVSDFFKVVAGELILVVSTGIITYFTAPRKVFYWSTVVWLVAILHKWLNTNCLSRTALSCLCDGYGLSPAMFLFSFIGFFDIGCHPIAKCSFAADKAFLFVRDDPNHGKLSTGEGSKDNIKESVQRDDPNHGKLSRGEGSKDNIGELDTKKLNKRDNPQIEAVPYFFRNEVVNTVHIEGGELNNIVGLKFNPPEAVPYFFRNEVVNTVHIEGGELNNIVGLKFNPPENRFFSMPMARPTVLSTVDMEQGEKELNAKVNWHQFNGAEIDQNHSVIEFCKWDAFERGLFQLKPRINFITRKNGKCILKSFMVLKLHHHVICEYPVDRLELPEEYSKANELFNFLAVLSLEDGFVTDKMRGRYEHSLTLSKIVEGVEENVGYRIVESMDGRFVVAG